MGTALSLPLIVAMVPIFWHWGLVEVVGPCVATDPGAALLMRQLSLVAGLETLIISLFLILGVKVSSWISGLLP